MTDYAKDRLEQAIARNRATLSRMVAVLFIKAGLDEGGAGTLPRHIWRAILLVLRPAESAVRRLVAAAARDIAVKLRARAPRNRKKARRAGNVAAGEATPKAGEKNVIAEFTLPAERRPQPRTGIFFQGRLLRPGETPWGPKTDPAVPARRPAFPLFDPPVDYGMGSRCGHAAAPVIRSLSGNPFHARGPERRASPEPPAGGEIGAKRLCRRLLALKRALDDLPGHAAGFARRDARRQRALEALWSAPGGTAAQKLQAANKYLAPPLRIGHPPGRRKRRVHPVDEVLRECPDLAMLVRRRPDTS